MPDINFTKINEFSDIELLDELMARFDDAIFSGLKVSTKENEVLTDFKGDENLIIQLCADIIVEVKTQVEVEEDIEED